MNKQPQGGKTQNQNPENNKGFQKGAQDNRANQKNQDAKINPTNRDNKITNNDKQKQSEEGVEEKSIPNPGATKRDDGNTEINTPVYTPDSTEEKIPKY